VDLTAENIYPIFFIDPNSYDNMSIYDWNLLSNIDQNVTFFGDKKYDYKTLDFKTKLVFGYSRHKNPLLKSIVYIQNSLRVAYYILKEKPDIIHYQWYKLPQFDLFLLKLLKTLHPKIHIIFTAHNILPHDTGKKYYKIYFKLYNKIDHLIVHTPSAKQEIIDNFLIHPNKITVIKHGLLDLLYDKENVRTISKNLISKHNLNDAIVFLFIGKINKYKGIDILIKAWEAKSEITQNKKLKLIIAGKGNSELLQTRSENIIIDNRYLDNNEFVSYLNIADVVVFPYRQISQSGVLLATLNMKKPILVSELPGLKEPFEFGHVGWIFEKLSAENLSQKLLHIAANKHIIEDIKSDHGVWNRVHSEYSWEKIGKLTSELYKSLI